ncbi:hypothetical protein ACHWQZ_G007997 [Mnemiopsis leidyi]
MLLKETEVKLDLTQGASHSLKNLGVVYLSLYLNHNKFHLRTSETTAGILKTPGCQTENVHVSGLANTARHLILLIDKKHPLLGHHAGCLSGTKEVSPWTNILEITFPVALAAANSVTQLQSTLGFLKETLNTPFIGHNARKIRQEAVKLGVLPEHGVLSHDDWMALPVIRRFVHGLHLGATDIILFGMISAKLHTLGVHVSQFQSEDNLVKKWFDRMLDLTKIVEGEFSHFLNENFVVELDDYSSLSVSEMIQSSSKDTMSCEKDGSVDDSVLVKMEKISEDFVYHELDDTPVSWDSLNDLLKPQRNSANNTNKMHQLKSILAGVHLCVRELKLRNLPQIRIVDFCSGAGHLGIFLAHNFPDCQVMLIETKWGSLRYAKERIDKLGLTNVTLCLAHMEQFIGSFELGVSLHACGSATDLVLRHCVRSNAAVVSSPCCYGKIVDSNDLKYPKSKSFRNVIHDHEDFFKVSRLADHQSNAENFMKCIDIDRIRHLQDCGYKFVSISKLKPLTCSPKNNLIVAVK